MATWAAANIPDQTGRLAVVTGANSGLGFEVASALASRGAQVVMACRNLDKANAAAERIAASTPDARVEVRQLDLGDLASIETFADELDQSHDHLDILINNAGLMGTDLVRSTDGFEEQFGVNHLGAYALTWRLLPLLTAAGRETTTTAVEPEVFATGVAQGPAAARAGARTTAQGAAAAETGETTPAAPGPEGAAAIGPETDASTARAAIGSRIVGVSSLAHRRAAIDFADPNFLERPYGRWRAYGQSKLANLLFTAELQRRLLLCRAAASALTAHPGLARTDLGIESNAITSKVVSAAMPVITQPASRGALPLLRAATDPSLRGGEFIGPRFFGWGDPVVERPNRKARDTDVARRLWDLSAELTGVGPDIAGQCCQSQSSA